MPQWDPLWQAIYPRIESSRKDSHSVLLSVETASSRVRQLVLELPPVASLPTAATTGATLIYRTPLSEWISGNGVVCSAVIATKASRRREASLWVTLFSWLNLMPGLVWEHKDTLTKKKELSRHKKADSFQITAKFQRWRVCREGMVSFASMHLWLSLSWGWIAGLGRIYHTFHTHKEQCCKGEMLILSPLWKGGGISSKTTQRGHKCLQEVLAKHEMLYSSL